MSTVQTPPRPDRAPPPPPKGDGVPTLLRPFVDFVAGIQARLETKLLVGFLAISVLMLTLAVVSFLVVQRMDDRVNQLTDLEDQGANAQAMLYSITSQSHFRTMALLTGEPVWLDKIATAKADFTELIAETRQLADAEFDPVFDELSAIDARYAEAGIRVDDLQSEGDVDGALAVHVQSEHEISHELEDVLNEFTRDTDLQIANSVDAFSGVRRFLMVALGAFSAVSLAGALALGAIISWTVIRPVREIDQALDTLAAGDFTTRIEVPNRDEFGKLSENVNRASIQLETLYARLESVNEDLQNQVDEQVSLLEHTLQLRRYLSPQIADSIIAGTGGLGEARRAELSVVFIDIRGFTALSEDLEPEEMTTTLNQFLTAMTEIVFDHEGTLDKYVGDAIMVFFNDPVPQEDHAERAVSMALEMQRGVADLSAQLGRAAMAQITAGVGISTGYVTVGSIGSPNRMDYTVIGNHVNLASRLADDAAPGEILITQRTHALLPQGMVQVEHAGERDLKGVHRPIQLYRIVQG